MYILHSAAAYGRPEVRQQCCDAMTKAFGEEALKELEGAVHDGSFDLASDGEKLAKAMRRFPCPFHRAFRRNADAVGVEDGVGPWIAQKTWWDSMHLVGPSQLDHPALVKNQLDTVVWRYVP